MKESPPNMAWGALKVGGAYLNFEERLHEEIITLKTKKKYYENQRKKVIRFILISTHSLIHTK